MKRIFCFILSLILCIAVFSGCGEETVSSAPTASSDTASLPTESQPDSGDSNDKTLYNPLTGEYDLAAALTSLPAAIMICNDNYTNSQPGIHTADMYVETETEGGISRIMTIFSDSSRVPELLGPVRSGRTPFIQITRALGMVYIHAGGSPKALEMVQQKDVLNINALGNSITTVRDDAMRAANANKYDHCLGVTGDAVVKSMEKNGFGGSYTYTSPWDYADSDITEGEDATAVEVKMSVHKTGNSFFEYDAASKKYKKNQGTAKSSTPHTSTSGEQIEVSNIVILFAEKYVEQRETYTRINFDLEEGGNAVVFTNGKKLTGKYKYSKDGMTVLDQSGNKIKVNTGKTYLYIMSDKYTSQVTSSAS